MSSRDETIRQINRSGFPFQLRVEQEVQETQQIHKWSVASREHAWVHSETGLPRFIDLVLSNNNFPTFRLVVECKRLKADDARQLRWIFLLPDLELKETKLTSCLEVEGNMIRPGNIPGWEDVRIWDNVLVIPSSLESEFCILPNDEQRKQPILEGLAGEVIESAEGLAEEEVRIARSNQSHIRLFIFSAIVTNAEISVCRFNSNKININDGTLAVGDTEISTVPFIRFRKSLVKDYPLGSASNLRAANKARERTVFIVNAASMQQFLTGWEIKPTGEYGRYAFQR